MCQVFCMERTLELGGLDREIFNHYNTMLKHKKQC